MMILVGGRFLVSEVPLYTRTPPRVILLWIALLLLSLFLSVSLSLSIFLSLYLSLCLYLSLSHSLLLSLSRSFSLSLSLSRSLARAGESALSGFMRGNIFFLQILATKITKLGHASNGKHFCSDCRLHVLQE